ncbi:hypothetical protein V8E36_006265, partial [Tilletia maclaganii]
NCLTFVTIVFLTLSDNARPRSDYCVTLRLHPCKNPRSFLLQITSIHIPSNPGLGQMQLGSWLSGCLFPSHFFENLYL